MELLAFEEQEAVLWRQDRRHRRAWRRVSDQRAHRLALIRGERGDVDKASDVLVRTGLGNDHTAVRVAGQNGRPALPVEHLERRFDIAVERHGRVLHHAHLKGVAREELIDALPARSVYEPTVHEHDVPYSTHGDLRSS